MEDEALTNILNLLQNNSLNTNKQQTNNTTSSTPTINNELQTMLIKFLLSGGLNQFINPNKNNTDTNAPEKIRTIDLKNYQRLD